MKGLLLIISFLISSFTYAQDITATLADTTAASGFSILNVRGDTLFRATGDGSIGIGTQSPTGLFDVRGKLDIGRGINIYAEDYFGDDNPGGKILLQGGSNLYFGGEPAKVSIGGAFGNGGDLNLASGSGSTGGNVHIVSGAGYGGPGNIIIETSNSNFGAGNITIMTHQSNDGGKIDIITGQSHIPNAGITLTAGNSLSGANSISLNAGSSSSDNGGDITLTPGSGGGGNPGGLVVVNGSGTYSGTWTQSSDERMKKNIHPITNAVDKIEQLKGVSFDWKSEEFPEKHFEEGKQLGLIAQDVEKILPELVKTDPGGYKSVAYQNMVAVLIEAVKEQQKQINTLNNKVETLEKKIAAGSDKVSSLTK